MTVAARLPLGGKPAGVAVAPDGQRVYVTSPEGGFVSVIDAKARRVEKRIEAPGLPFGVAVAPDGGKIYVADMNGRELTEIDASSGAKRKAEVGAVPSGVAVTPDGAVIVVSARDDDALVLLDAKTLAKRATIPVGHHPFGLAIDAAGERAYCVNVESDDLSVVDLKAQKLVATVKVGKRPYGVALARGRVFAANQYDETVSVLDAQSLAPLGRDQGRGISRKPLGEPRWSPRLCDQLVLERAMGPRRARASKSSERSRRGKGRAPSAAFVRKTD